MAWSAACPSPLMNTDGHKLGVWKIEEKSLLEFCRLAGHQLFLRMQDQGPLACFSPTLPDWRNQVLAAKLADLTWPEIHHKRQEHHHCFLHHVVPHHVLGHQTNSLPSERQPGPGRLQLPPTLKALRRHWEQHLLGKLKLRPFEKHCRHHVLRL